MQYGIWEYDFQTREMLFIASLFLTGCVSVRSFIQLPTQERYVHSRRVCTAFEIDCKEDLLSNVSIVQPAQEMQHMNSDPWLIITRLVSCKYNFRTSAPEYVKVAITHLHFVKQDQLPVLPTTQLSDANIPGHYVSSQFGRP